MTATLIVMERDGRWAAALRGAFDRGAVPCRLIEVRSLDECWDELRGRPGALLAIELTEPLLQWILAALCRLERECPQAAMLVLMERRLARCIPLLREAGAVHCIVSPRRLGEAVELVQRHAARQPAAADGPEQVFADLPWSER